MYEQAELDLICFQLDILGVSFTRRDDPKFPILILNNDEILGSICFANGEWRCGLSTIFLSQEEGNSLRGRIQKACNLANNLS